MYIFQFISGLAHTCRSEHCALTCWYSKAQTRDHFWECQLMQGYGTASGMLRKAQLCLKDSPGLSAKIFFSTPHEDGCFSPIAKAAIIAKLIETTHVFSSLHLTPKNTIHVRKVEPKYAQIKASEVATWDGSQILSILARATHVYKDYYFLLCEGI